MVGKPGQLLILTLRGGATRSAAHRCWSAVVMSARALFYLIGKKSHPGNEGKVGNGDVVTNEELLLGEDVVQDAADADDLLGVFRGKKSASSSI